MLLIMARNGRPADGHAVGEVEPRASDRDRERVVDGLRTHAAEGRLTVEELEDRVQRALGARTAGELAALTRDLPDLAPLRMGARSPRARSAGRPEARTYVAVMVLLVAVWALAGAGYFWPVWPAVGWGFFLLVPGDGRGRCARGRRASWSTIPGVGRRLGDIEGRLFSARRA
jgi:hypothetical protein